MKLVKDESLFAFRIFQVVLFISVVFVLIIFRLWFLQGFKGSFYRDKSKNNRTRAVRIVAERGYIYDRNGKELVKNRPAFNLSILKEDVEDLDRTLSLLSEITNVSKSELEERIKNSKTIGHFQPKIVLPDIDRNTLAKLKVNFYRLPGVVIEVVPARVYPRHQLLSQSLGYVREINKDQLTLSEDYKSGDLIGQSGVEKILEEELRGENGSLKIEVDARGVKKRELGSLKSKKGQDIYLTVDSSLQEVAEKAFEERKGALVAMDPNNGQILALVSSPTFDPMIFSKPLSNEDWRGLSLSEERPLRNRAISNHYPPGSTFKLIAAVAGLASKSVTPETRFNCPGYYTLGDHRFHCHKRSGHGVVNMQQAVEQSCNVYFFNLGLNLLGISELHRYGKMFGFGQQLGIEILGEDSGIMPNPAWKKKIYKQEWYPGDTVPVSIGQGFIAVTPLQLASAISALVNGGILYKPKLILSKKDGVFEEKEILHKIEVAPWILETVKQYAKSVVSGEHGTGKRAAIEGIAVGGKTGTAQVVGGKKDENNKKIQDHALFVSFAPVDKPKIVLAIIVENAGGGGLNAAPISKIVMESFFGIKKDTEIVEGNR